MGKVSKVVSFSVLRDASPILSVAHDQERELGPAQPACHTGKHSFASGRFVSCLWSWQNL